MKEIVKGSLVIFVFKVFGAIALFLTHILISRYYGAETLGIFNLILALMMMASILSQVGLDMYVVRLIPSLEHQYSQISLFLKEVVKLLFFTSLTVTVLLYLLSGAINRYIFKSFDASNYLIGLVVVTIPFAFFNVLPEIFRGFHEIKLYSFLRNLSQNLLLLVILTLGIVTAMKFDPVYALYITIIVISLSSGAMLFKFLKKKNITLYVEGKYQNKILAYSYPMFLTSSMMFIMGYIDSFMISYYLDEYQVGIYNACVKLSLAVTFILTTINGFIGPKIAQAYSQGDKQRVKSIYNNSVKLVILSTTPIFLLLYIFPEFFLGLFGEEFIAATKTLLIINTAFLVNAFSGSVGYILNMTDNQYIFMKILMIGVLINIILNVVLIPLIGIDGAAIATLISMSFWNIGSLIILKLRKIL